MPIRTRRLVLSAVTEDDYPLLFEWRNTEDFSTLVSSNGINASYEQFLKEQKAFSSTRNVQYILKRKADNVAVGYVFTVGYNNSDQFAFLNIFVAADFKTKGYGAEGSIALLHILFTQRKLYKVYLDVLVFNTPSKSMIETAGFQLEGNLKGHRRIGAKRVNVLRFAAYLENMQRLTKIAKIQEVSS